MQEKAIEQEEVKGMDITLIISVLILLGIGVTMVYSASSVFAAKKYDNQYFFLKKQVSGIILGLFIMFAVAQVNFNRYRKLTYVILGAAIVLLTMVFIPGIGFKANGASRWIKIAGMTFQPAEFAKLAIVFYLAYSLQKKSDNIKNFSIGFLPHVIVTGIILALILIQPDLGSVVIISAILFAMLFIAGVRVRYLVVSVLMLLPVAYGLIMNVAYRRKRMMTFFDPLSDPTGAGFQITQSFLALGSGGLFGMGLGDGKQKLFYLPEPHTDFILSVLGEELGFVGLVITLLIFFVIIYRGFKISLESESLYGSLLALGITLIIGMQAVINAGVVMGMLPTKGLVLPFISYGRTAIIINLFSVGVLLNISSKKKSW
ncbi:putative lipid II flippase FtsW [Thermodesulfobacteriota bacterium]